MFWVNYSGSKGFGIQKHYPNKYKKDG